ncbi:hypothetical protein EJB05_46444, partial [Eragrostis curvula]
CDGQDKVTSIESQIRRIVFYPDGTPKSGPNSPEEKNPNYKERCLVQVVLDQYNDDHKLFGDVTFGLCYGCTRDGSTEVQHPKNTDACTGGRVDCRYLTFGGDPFGDSDNDEDTQVAKLWIKLKGRHAPFVRENIITWK